MATKLALAMTASLSAAGLKSGANEGAAALAKLGSASQDTFKKLDRFGSAVQTLAAIEVGRVFVGMAQSITGAGQSAVAYAANVANAIDATNDLSNRIGIGVEELQALQMAAKLAGVGDATTAFQKLAVAIGKAGESDKAQETFTRLGIDFAALQAMEPEEQFKAISAAIAALPTEAERAAAAVSMFGKSGMSLLPLMGENIDAVKQKMERLGGVVSEDQTAAIAAMNDQLDWTKAAFDGIIGQVVGNLAPAVSSLVDDMLSFVETYQSASGVTGGSGIADTITEALFRGVDYLGETFDWAVSSLMDAGDMFTTTFAIIDGAAKTFEFVGQLLYGGFKTFEIAGNLIVVAFGKLLEGLGSWVSSDLEDAGKQIAAVYGDAAAKNAAAIDRIGMGDATQGEFQSGRKAAAAVREGINARNDPGRIAARDAERAKRDAARADAARDAEQARMDKQFANARKANEKALADANAREANARKKRDDEIAKAEDKVTTAGQFREEAASVLSRSAAQALSASDVRSSEGMSQFLALATGREDPAIAEYRKQFAELAGIRAALVALRAEPIAIVGSGAGGA